MTRIALSLLVLSFSLAQFTASADRENEAPDLGSFRATQIVPIKVGAKQKKKGITAKYLATQCVDVQDSICQATKFFGIVLNKRSSEPQIIDLAPGFAFEPAEVDQILVESDKMFKDYFVAVEKLFRPTFTLLLLPMGSPKFFLLYPLLPISLLVDVVSAPLVWGTAKVIDEVQERRTGDLLKSLKKVEEKDSVVRGRLPSDTFYVVQHNLCMALRSRGFQGECATN